MQAEEKKVSGRKDEFALMEQIYRSVYENSVYGIAVFTRIGRLIALNRRGREILGYGLEDPVEIDIRSYFYGNDALEIECELAQLVLLENHPGEHQDFSHPCMRMDGSVIWLEGRRELIFMEDGTSFVLSMFSNMTEKRQVEEKLTVGLEQNRQHRQMLLDLYDSIPVGVLQQTTSHPAVCVSVNTTSVRLLGYQESPQEFIHRGQDFFSCVYTKDRKALEDIVSLTNMEKSRSFEGRLLLPDGNLRWVKGEVQRLLNMEGDEILQFCFSDNTTQKSMELALEEERRRNKLIADSTTSVILEYHVAEDTAYKFRNMRHKDGRISGHHLTIRNMLRKMRESGLIHPDDCDQFERCLVNGYGASMNVRMRNGKNQSYVWYRGQFSSFYEYGVLKRVLCIMDNIQDMIDMQDEKEVLTELCHLIVSEKYELIDLIDVNERTYHYYVTEREWWQQMPQSGDYDEMLSVHIIPMAYDAAAEETIRNLSLDNVHKRLLAGETVREYLKLKEGDGFHWKQVEFCFLKSDKSRIFQLLSDIHEERVNQERLEKALADANAANAAKNDFLANISHEIRTPMNAIIGISEILLNKNISKDMEEKLMSIQRAGNGLLDIINGILDFSKIEAGKTELTEAPYNLIELITGISDIMLAQLAKKPVCLFVRKEEKVPVWLMGDELKTRQILMNVLGNAVKFTESGHIHFWIGGELLGDGHYRLEMEISDSGRGIRKEDQPKIFSAFEQVDEQRNRGVTGTGLGLPISRHLARLMGGDIQVESSYGEGSTFFINILQKTVPNQQVEMENTDREKKMLVLETEPELVEELCWQIEHLPVQGEFCTSLEKCSHLEEVDYIFLRIRTLQRLWDSGQKLPKKAKTVLILEQNELVSREYNDYAFVQIPLFGIQVERMLRKADDLWGNEASANRKIYDIMFPGVKILIVDDNEINRMVTEEFLRPYQISSDQAESGNRAVQMAFQERYDLVFMDQMMPGMDGVETAQKMKKISGYESVPIVALTADATQDTRKQFENTGFAGYLIKPVHMEHLEQILRKCLADRIQEVKAECKREMQERSDFYPVLLRAYQRDVQAILEELPKAFYSGDRHNFTILAHRLKGASSEVGTSGLEEQAAKMERYGKENDWDGVTRNFDNFLQNIRRVLTSVEEKLGLEIKKEKNNVDIEYKASFDYNRIKDLKSACDDARYDDAEKILDEISSYRYDTEHMKSLKHMRKLCDSLRYDELEQVVNRLWIEEQQEKRNSEVKQ